VVVLLLMGFPIALIVAWAYDVTPQGIRATPAPTTPGSHRRRNLIMLIAIGVIISAGAGFFLLPRVSARKVEKSIAVLPFQNLSDEKENAYFADGMQDDILTNLSKIGDLKVISRMSVMSYRGDGARNAREIGKALGVATLFCFIECFFPHVRPSTPLGFLYDEARTPFRTFKRDFWWSEEMITVAHLASLINALRAYHLAISCPL
jgi:hypothetical protein